MFYFHSSVHIWYSLVKRTVLLVNVSLIQCAVSKYDKINVQKKKPLPCYSCRLIEKSMSVKEEGVVCVMLHTVICILRSVDVVIPGDDV